ncbi:Arabinose efflux permease [Arthrobacter sp. 31Cvi3.1E]|nr:Arabinose efflux permease [Arthrobacter sp. 31Cvi3.1E]
MTVMHRREIPPVPSESIARKDPKKAAMSGWIGSALEYYDFALYSLAATLLFPTIFFPTENPTVGIIASLATYAVGYVSRPLGAVVLGAYGDRHGRKKVLVFAMLLMGFATFAVGLLPTFGQVGLLAPVMLVILRLIQGFAVAGELGGASAMIVEHSPDARRGFFASFSLQGTQVGSILATAVLIPLAALLPDEEFHSWGWRLPFLLSAVVIVAGYVIRRRVQEPPAYLAQSEAAPAKRRFPLADLLRTHPWVLVRCIAMTFTNVIGMATLIFGVSFATQKGYGIGFSSSEFLWVTMAANVTAVLTIPAFGALSDKIGRRALMVAGGMTGGAADHGLPLGHRTAEPALGVRLRCDRPGHALPDVERHLRHVLPGAVPHADARHGIRGVPEHRTHDCLVLPEPVYRNCSPGVCQHPHGHRADNARHLHHLSHCHPQVFRHQGQDTRGA